MRSIKLQYLLCFAVYGSTQPFLTVFFKHRRGLSETQIGYIMAVSGAAILLSPLLITLLADTRVDARRLMAGIFIMAASALTLMGTVAGFWLIFACFGLYRLAYAPSVALQDGINFSVQRQRLAQGLVGQPYHRVRVWGTIGFIVPAVVLFAFLQAGSSLDLIVAAAVICCALGAINTFTLPDPRLRQKPAAESELAKAGGLPTAGAAKLLLQPNMLVLCAALWLALLASCTYDSFYPLYLTDRVGIDDKWIGLIGGIGVLIEVFYTLAFGRLLRRFGFKRLIVAGIASQALRLALLASFANVTVAIGTQVLHGMWVVGLLVAPPLYLNRRAADTYRHSIQGLYAMAVAGTGRITGNFIAGHVAQVSLTTLFAYGSALCAVAVTVLMIGFADGAVSREA